MRLSLCSAVFFATLLLGFQNCAPMGSVTSTEKSSELPSPSDQIDQDYVSEEGQELAERDPSSDLDAPLESLPSTPAEPPMSNSPPAMATEPPINATPPSMPMDPTTGSPSDDSKKVQKPLIQPFVIKGFGGQVSGGRFGKVVHVTNTSSDSSTPGSFFWALRQHPGEPLAVLVMVEGNLQLMKEAFIQRGNLTLDFRYAPGNGFWFTGKRIGIRASNVHLINGLFLGNDSVNGGGAKALTVGGPLNSGSNLVHRNILIERTLIAHGRDEAFSIVNRENGAETGVTVKNFQLDSSIIANATATNGHQYLLFVGDGTESSTFSRNLLFNGVGRYPFIREHCRQIEWVNNLAYNFSNLAFQVLGKAQVNVVNNVFKLGPLSTGTLRPILFTDPGHIHEAGSLLSNLSGRSVTLFHQTAGQSVSISNVSKQPLFAPSSYEVLKSVDVEAYLLQHSGPRKHGGARLASVQKILDQMRQANAPTARAFHPGEVPAVTAAKFPANRDGVPLDYLKVFPEDVSLENLIEGDTLWAGRQVWERVGEWLIQSR